MSKHTAMPASSDDRDARRSPELPTPRHRADDAGYRSVGVIDTPQGRVNVIDVADLHAAGEAFGSLRLLVDLMADGKNRALAEMASGLAGFWAQRMRVLAAGSLVAALVVAIGGLSLAYSPGAMAATRSGYSGAIAAPSTEAPQPDPAVTQSGVVYRVVLDRAYPTLTVPVVGMLRTPAGVYCTSLYLRGSYIAYRCSTSRFFTLRVVLDGAALPLGRSGLELVDEGTGSTVLAAVEVRRPSRFGAGTFLDLGSGDLFASVPLAAYSPTAGRWVPQQASPVQIQERVGGRWVLRATLITGRGGVAQGVVHLGGGVHVFRVVRPEGKTVTGTTGRVRVVNLLTEPVDVI